MFRECWLEYLRESRDIVLPHSSGKCRVYCTVRVTKSFLDG